MVQLSFEEFSEQTIINPSGTLEKPAVSRALGHVITPMEVVEFMVSLAEPTRSRECRVLEPGCGDARFLRAFAKKYGDQHRLVGIEINRDIAIQTRKLVQSNITIIEGDFLLWQFNEKFDFVIGNPPYGIVGDSSHYPIHLLNDRKENYKKVTNTWKGKYNIYGAFIEKGVRLLAPHGKLIFIVPTTWMILDDFSLLRCFLSQQGRISVFYLGRVFSGVNVSAVVLLLEKDKTGIRLYDLRHTFSRSDNLRISPSVEKTQYSGEIIRFETEDWLSFEQTGIPLSKVFNIYFAARSPEFRKKGIISTVPCSGYVPVLTGRNLRVGFVDYERCFSGWWMRPEDAPLMRWFYSIPHLVVGHTKGLRMVCAMDWKCYPWREEYHLIPRAGFTVDWNAVEKYLNSEIVQRYLSEVYLDISPHLTKTILHRIPILEDVIQPRQFHK